MENSERIEAMEDIAAQWLLKRDGEKWLASDEQALAAWLDADTSHWVVFTRLESVWDQTDRMRVLSCEDVSKSVPARGALAQSVFLTRKHSLAPDRNRSKFPGGTKSIAALAASLLIVVCVTVGAYVRSSSGASYRSAIGSLTTVPLEDGSSIVLNTDSTVRVKFGKKERGVSLTQGEAFFDVAKDPNRPFVVYAADQRVVVLGTRFSVRIKPDAVQIAVTEGQVRIDETSLLKRGKSLADVTAGYVADVRKKHAVVEPRASAEIEQDLSWRSGFIVMQRMPLAEVAAEFNRYNHQQLTVTDSSIAGIKITGNLRWNNLDGLLRLLHDGFGIQAQRQGTQIALGQKKSSKTLGNEMSKRPAK